MTTVTVVIPTRNRPGPLARALASLARQALPADVAVDVVVADNSDAPVAEGVVREVGLTVPVRCLMVPQPGVSTVRNAAVAAATGELVAFLDDDCEADPGWLAAQVATLAQTGADASFGPRIARVEGGEPAGVDWFVSTYSRDLELPDGTDVTQRDAHLPLPGAAFVRARCLYEAEPFDPRLDAIGGEDVHLFRRLRRDGRRFVWSPAARVEEYIAPNRLDVGFVMRRRYLSGQHRCLVPMLVRPPQRGEMLSHMAKGAVAAAATAPVALGARAVTGRWPLGPTALLMSGLGKLTWWRRERPALYGAGHR